MLLMFLALILQGIPSGHQITSREAILTQCLEHFGQRVENSPILFDINRFYVLHVEFGADDQLAKASIEPKFYYEDTHPDWEEPDKFEWLSTGQVGELLSRLDRLRPLGKLVRRHSGVVFVTNLTGPQTDEYENAAVTRGEVVDIRRPANAPVLVRYIRVQYKS